MGPGKDDEIELGERAHHSVTRTRRQVVDGVRLRVLVPERHAQPIEIIERALRAHHVSAQASLSAATLEDVFVAVTMPPSERDQ